MIMEPIFIHSVEMCTRVSVCRVDIFNGKKNLFERGVNIIFQRKIYFDYSFHGISHLLHPATHILCV